MTALSMMIMIMGGRLLATARGSHGAPGRAPRCRSLSLSAADRRRRRGAAVPGPVPGPSGPSGPSNGLRPGPPPGRPGPGPVGQPRAVTGTETRAAALVSESK